MRLAVQRVAVAALLAGLAGLAARASSDPLAPPPVGAHGMYRVHLPHVANGATLPGHRQAPGPLLVGRAEGHTLTRLVDGRVLVVGGSSAVELWVPHDRRAHLVDPLPAARSHHVAVRLSDGRVLVAGGQGSYRYELDDLEPLASALIFDPASASWHPAPPMAVARRAPVAALLPDGRVLVAGGEVGDALEPPSAEVFVPELGQWRPYPAPTRRPSALVPLPDGRVLALHDPIVGYLGAETLDPASETWHAQPSPSTLHQLGAHVGLRQAGVLVVFGRLAERFDPQSGRWEPAAPPPAPLWHPTATLLEDGSALFLGSAPSGRAYRYDPVGNRWSTAGYTEHVHHGQAMTRLVDGRVLVAGGSLDDARVSEPHRVTELFDPVSEAWTASWPAPQGRIGHTATVLRSGWALIAGGQRGRTSGYTPRPAIVSPDLTRWVVGDPLPTELVDQAATALDDGRVLITGGRVDGGMTAQAMLFEPETMRWRPTQEMAVPRAGHASIRLIDGTVLVVGGGAAERFDPVSEHWQPAGSFEPHGDEPRLARLDDGSVLMIGGRDERSAERFDPATGLWRTLPPLPADRDRPATAVLQDGRVLVAGGCCATLGDRTIDRSSFIFDPRSETWSQSSPLILGRIGASAFTLPDGSVLLAGGCCAVDASERYDTRTAAWRLTGRLNVPRDGAVAAQRADGTVIVTGGCCDDATGLPFTSSEWFDADADLWRLVEAEVVIPAPGVVPSEAP